MIEILGQKFEKNDLIYIKNKKNNEYIGFIKDRDIFDKIFGWNCSISTNKNKGYGESGFKAKDIVEIKKLEVKNE